MACEIQYESAVFGFYSTQYRCHKTHNAHKRFDRHKQIDIRPIHMVNDFLSGLDRYHFLQGLFSYKLTFKRAVIN